MDAPPAARLMLHRTLAEYKSPANWALFPLRCKITSGSNIQAAIKQIQTEHV